jgi:hypothetical protein
VSEEEGIMDSGVKVVGATSPDDAPSAPGAGEPAADGTLGGGGPERRQGGVTGAQPPRRIFLGTVALAVLGLLGTLVFGLLWAGSSNSGGQDPAVKSAARNFLSDLTNFDAKTIDADFGSITSMATGAFAGQADKFFNSSIRNELEVALAESRGQIRYLFVQSESATQAVIYAVVDQVYVNNKISTPQSDVLRILVNLQKVGSTWKISDVTVLEGATPASTGSSSGSAGSSVPGQ